jgi:ABC-type nitrate/sulfonate/bicarbonate transport system substrate-binding protein
VWLNVLLARARLTPAQVHIVSAGSHGVARALTGGEVHAAFVPDAVAGPLVAERRATLLADLRTPDAAQRALGFPTVSAGVFVRGERRPGERELAAFTRAILAAEERLASGRTGELASRLPKSVVGSSAAEFEARVQQARALYLPEGRVSEERLEMSVTFLRDSLPLPGRARIQLLPPGRVKATPGN